MAYSNSAPGHPRPSYIPHPKEYIASDSGPFWGAIATQIGGALILIEGIWVGLAGSSLPSWLYQVLFTLSPASEGWLLVVSGVIFLVLGWLAYYSPTEDRLDGAVIWLLLFLVGFTTLISAGFYVGALLVGTGASHIFWWKPKRVGGTESIRRARG
ncbi:MAG: hypothetical protein L3K17_05655 [Thermoplasmata archaeon]|nr:hypothetical protein [Thermoplasmata archaeon]